MIFNLGNCLQILFNYYNCKHTFIAGHMINYSVSSWQIMIIDFSFLLVYVPTQTSTESASAKTF